MKRLLLIVLLLFAIPCYGAIQTDGVQKDPGGGSGSGDVIAPATNTDGNLPRWSGANSKTLSDGVAVPAGGLAGLTALGNKLDTSAFSDAGVTGKLITGYTSGAGTVAATDTILQAINKLNGNAFNAAAPGVIGGTTASKATFGSNTYPVSIGGTSGDIGVFRNNNFSLAFVTTPSDLNRFILTSTEFDRTYVGVNNAGDVSLLNGSLKFMYANGHWSANGTAPALTNCGTSPTIESGSNDHVGIFTIGSTGTGCTITFAVAYTNAPACVVSGGSASTHTQTNAALTVVAIPGVYNYNCTGLNQ
jgi:hypothetical protein